MKDNLSRLIGIAGGSGAGKSTLCLRLQDEFPQTIACVQLDDYFKPKEEVPKLAGFENWDHPDAIRFEALTTDLRALQQGESVVIQTKNEKLNPDFAKTGRRIPVEFHPKPIVLVEGFFTLFDPRIRELLSTSIWLEAEHDIRWSRRVHFKSDDYNNAVARPMHRQFVDSQKKYAEHVIHVATVDANAVYVSVLNLLKPFGLPSRR
ncbi:MAG: hypothetical protein Q8Q20_02500 [bacterium]|nr:hypothetical protein [bacterium]